MPRQPRVAVNGVFRHVAVKRSPASTVMGDDLVFDIVGICRGDFSAFFAHYSFLILSLFFPYRNYAGGLVKLDGIALGRAKYCSAKGDDGGGNVGMGLQVLILRRAVVPVA